MRSLKDVPLRDWIIAVTFVLLNAADAAITIHAEHHVPGMYEANPLMRWCIQQSDLFFVAVKMGWTLLITWFSLKLDLGRRLNIALLIGSSMLAVILIWNIVLYAISTARL